jgi:septum formation topological specificity factor MinE
MKNLRNFRLRYIEQESYDLLPEHIQEKKNQYHTLVNNIKKREKKIEGMMVKIGELKNELKEMKLDRTEKYNELFEFHDTFIPTISITYSGKQKGEKKNFNDRYYYHSNNSWSITMRLKKKVKNIYIGTDSVLKERLNEIYDTDRFSKLKSNYVEEKKQIQSVVKKLVEGNIIKELTEIVGRGDSVDEFLSRKGIKGIDYVKLR